MRIVLKNTLLISSLGHLLVFGLFSFSFDQSGFRSQEPALVFWGQVLPRAALDFKEFVLTSRASLNPRLDTVLPDTGIPGSLQPSNYSAKPQVSLPFNPEKSVFAPPDMITEPPKENKDTPIMFHPLLPYQLQLYFKDRQAVHIELMFKISPGGRGKNLITVQRKISSGNPEADLLSLRYINHYLFIQQSGFPQNSWQTVKIDLSTKDD